MSGKDRLITPSELIVMKVIWKEQPCTASQIVDRISKRSDWHFRTIKTLLRNLVAKQAVGYRVDAHDSRVYHYYALVQEEDYLKQEREQFLKLYYDGSLSTLLTGFLKDGSMTPEEAGQLRSLLNRRMGEQDDGGTTK
ncbi:BlaI/MecI/CopY family transcriptional regulator [Paenibacillus hemerocallicola]|uniref:BlaI/MecI/CopY family transcriptional regulator n=1 Tax=Paenibacillus hemerocallicola TaxID=1172614 RepID=A0A5C4TGB3_9BACL|nr:BlaI/MecI/CopY family transcriptional regulator [Paenibacillus hemerocallicola]TNJ68091.1 BlaI/MecI/CopY family transcriptional regulator [Paenibacillus hemerocallicola]